MAFAGNFMSSTFKRELLVKGHDFTITTGDSFKLALYDNTATLTAATATYGGAGIGELTASGNYVVTGNALTNVTPTLSGTTALTDFVDEVWSTATFTARGALLYNDTDTTGPDATVAVLDFGTDKTATAGDFTVQFPVADASNAIIRIA